MQTIGERLEEARKHKGISLREAAESTKIRGEYLSAFENNSFQIDLPEIYIRGFLRNYANFLKLNGTRILTDYDAVAGNDDPQFSKPAQRESQSESYGRLELGNSAAGPSTESTAATVTRENEEAQERRRDSAFSAEDSRDRSFYIKTGAIVAASLIAAVAVITIVVSIIGSDSAETAENEALAEGVKELTLVGRGNIDEIRVTEIETGEVLYVGSIAEDGRIALRRRGPVNIYVSHREHLRIEEDGRGGNTPGTGAGRARWEGWPQ